MCFNVTTMYLGFQGITFVNCLYRLNFNIYFGLFHSKNAWVTIFQKKKISVFYCFENICQFIIFTKIEEYRLSVFSLLYFSNILCLDK